MPILRVCARQSTWPTMSPRPSSNSVATAGIGLSEAVNELVRSGLSADRHARPFRQKTHDLGRGLDVSNIAEAIETLDGPAAR